MLFNDVTNATLNITIIIKRDILRRNVDLLSDNKNLYLKEYYYKKVLIKRLT